MDKTEIIGAAYTGLMTFFIMGTGITFVLRELDTPRTKDKRLRYNRIIAAYIMGAALTMLLKSLIG